MCVTKINSCEWMILVYLSCMQVSLKLQGIRCLGLAYITWLHYTKLFNHRMLKVTKQNNYSKQTHNVQRKVKLQNINHLHGKYMQQTCFCYSAGMPSAKSCTFNTFSYMQHKHIVTHHVQNSAVHTHRAHPRGRMLRGSRNVIS